jgi:hypothetical protein
MNGRGRWRRWATALARHAASTMPGARSPWADAMRRELEYIADDRAALRWAFGCVLASYRARLTCRPRWNVGVRQVAVGGTLVLLVGVAIQDRAGGQTVPRPVVDERACDLSAGPGYSLSDCTDPMTPSMPSNR